MKINDIVTLEESIVNVPNQWIKKIASYYEEPIKYAYIKYFGENQEERKELSDELSYSSMNTQRDDDIVANAAKLTILVQELPLVDQYNETFIDDTKIMLVANYNLNTSNNGSYTNHPTYGHMLIVNIAAPMVEGSERGDDDKSAINHAILFLKEIIEHELVHLIQHEKGNKNQLKFNKAYKTDKKEYYKSPVEFNAMITSFVRDFEGKLKELSSQDKTLLGYDNINNALLNSIGYSKSYKETGKDSIDKKGQELYTYLTEPNRFLMTLKSEKPEQWKRAVKSITKHFEKVLKQ